MIKPGFGLDIRRRGSTLQLLFKGELDRPVVREVWRSLELGLRELTDRLVLDLTAVTFIDGAGLRTIFEVDERGREEGWDVTVVRPSGPASRVFTLTGAASQLSLVDERDAARQAG